MTHHTRSEKSKEKRATEQSIFEQKRVAQQYILDASFRDPMMAETVSRTDFHAVMEFLGQKFPFVFPSVTDVFKGEVLADARGRGTYQK